MLIDVKSGFLTKVFRCVAASTLMLAAATSHGLAQDFPNRSIRAIVAFSPGGGLDIFCRLVSQAVSQRIGQTIVVDNRPGANGEIGMRFLAEAAPDGYTIACIPHNITQNAQMSSSAPDIFTAMTPVAKLVNWNWSLAVRNDAPFKDFKSFLAFAKENPKKVKFGTSGASSRVTAAFIGKEAGVEFLDVPFPGAAPAITSLLGGTTDAAFVTLSEALAGRQAGQFTILASISEARNPLLSDVPAIGEYFPGVDLSAWYGIVAPPGTDAAIVSKLNQEFTAAVNDPKLKAELEKQGFFADTTSAEDFAKTIKFDYDRYGDVIKAIGLAK